MTYSIVARDPESGAFGVATATGGPCVGALVPHAASGVGAIATQGDTNPLYGVDGLSLLHSGAAADEVAREVVGADPGNHRRQLIVIGRHGAPAAFNGGDLEPANGCLAGADFIVAGNMLKNMDVLKAMAQAFQSHAGQLEGRLLCAMQAGEQAGGDKRGTKSAALLVYSNQPYADFDCRVDLAENPLSELATLLQECRSGEYARFLAKRPSRDLLSSNNVG